MKNIICILVFVFSLIFISQNKASAQDLLSNPFLSATSIKKLHEQNFKASQKLVYEIKNTAPNKNEETEIINIYLSKNWALVERGDYKILFDFVLQREFVINAKNNSFYSKSLIGPVFFRIMERQNRIAIADIISPVSYTHLDVYKRQLPNFRRLHQNLANFQLLRNIWLKLAFLIAKKTKSNAI